MSDKRDIQLATLDNDEVAREELLDLINEARTLSEQGGFAFSSLHQADFFAKIDSILSPPQAAPQDEPVQTEIPEGE